MSTAAISGSFFSQPLQTYFQQRRSDLQQLSQDLQAGNLAAAQQDYSTLQALGQSGPFANGDTFKSGERQQDFAAIGQALQSGDLAGAQQALAQLESTFHHGNQTAPPLSSVIVNIGGSPSASGNVPSQPSGSVSGSTSSGPEIVLNLGNVTPGEQISIGLSNPGNGGEQVTIGVSGQANQSPEQIAINFSQNSAQQIVLNLFNSTASSSLPGSSVSVSA